MATSDAPIRIGRVALTVNDLATVGDFYQRVVGLRRLSQDGGTMVLGAGDRPLLELREDRAARHRPAEAGLFHTAFLLPGRIDLADWLGMAAARGLALDGASDHRVSEAVYLRDPEGNGIEIYADRPRDAWRWSGGEVAMATERLDVEGLLAAAAAPWAGAPLGTMVGHVHLQVGDVAEAERFYHGRLGFDVTTHYPGAAFFSTGGYHHHLAANVWNSRGAGPRAMPSTGLAELVLAVRDPARLAELGGEGAGFADPWATPLRLEAA